MILRRTFDTVRQLRPELRVLFITTLLFRTGTMAFPFLAAYLVGRGDYSGKQVGAIVAAYGVGALVADLSAGPLLRAVSGRSVMLAGLVGNALLVAVLPLAHEAAILMAASFVWGVLYEVFTPASYQETISHSTEEERKVAFSCNRLAINLGGGVGPAVGGVVFVWQPTALFFINAAMVLVAAGYLAVRMRGGSTRRPPATRGRAGLISESLKSETRFWSVFVLALPIHLAFALPPTFLSTYVINERGMSSVWAGAIFTVNAFCVVLFEVPLNTAMREVSHFWSMTAGYVLAALGFVLVGFADSGPTLIGATLLWTAAEMIVFPSLMHYVSSVSEPGISARNMGLYAAGVNVGLIAVPQVSLLLVTREGAESPWYLAGALIGVALLVIVAVRRNSYLWLTEDTDDEVKSARVPG